MSENEIDLKGKLMKLLRERLEEYKIPNERILALRDEIWNTMNSSPVKKPFGACVMTAEASMDKGTKPRII